LQEGSYFLSPSVNSYDETYNYFFGVDYKIDHNQYKNAKIKCVRTFGLVPKLKHIYKQFGAHTFRSNSKVRNNLVISDGYTKMFVTDVPLDGELYLYTAPDSAVRLNNSFVNLMLCMRTTSPYDCLTIDPLNKWMLAGIYNNTKVKLDKQICFSGFVIAVTVLSVVFVAICAVSIICMTGNNGKDGRNLYDVVDVTHLIDEKETISK
jgi:hypothetical protein